MKDQPRKPTKDLDRAREEGVAHNRKHRARLLQTKRKRKRNK